MMNDKQILSLINTRISAAFRSPGVIVSRDAIATIAKSVVIEESYPFIDALSTEDATPTVIKTIELQDYEGGLLDVDVLGMVTDGSKFIIGKYVVRYKRTTTAGITFEEILFNADGTTALIEFNVNVDLNIEVKVTGIAATDIDWNCYVIQKKILATAAP